ncbi:MAG: Uma2 family endonuclease [Sulfuricella sp.]|nr:Uma2 family endonuclease [Sulfuricella sp.]
MSHAVEIERYTVEDYRRWEGDWELIDGVPQAMAPSPLITHQRIAGEIHGQLYASLRDCPRCQPLFEIDVEFSDNTVVRPDVLVICYEPEGDRLTRAPDLVFEVLSKTTARRDEVTKFDLYRAEGVGHYVLIYPEAHKAKVYRLVDGEYRKVGDFVDEKHIFDLSKCTIDFDFSRLWRRKMGA